MEQDDWMDDLAENDNYLDEGIGSRVTEKKLRERLRSPAYKKLRKRIEKVLREVQPGGRRLSDAQWLTALSEADVQPDLDDDGVRDVAHRLAGRQRHAALAREIERQSRGERPSDDPRFRALADILASEAEADGMVSVWRIKWLGGGREERTVPDRDWKNAIRNLQAGPRSEGTGVLMPMRLAVNGPSAFMADTVPLVELDEAARWLGERYGFFFEPAVRLILTGRRPRISPIAWQLDVSTVGPRKLVMHIDPRTPRTVVGEVYAAIRQQLKDATGVQTETKPLSEEHAELARFLARFARSVRQRPAPPPDDEETRRRDAELWSDAFVAWNRLHRRRPDWQYNELRLFKRDANAAFERVTGATWPLDWEWQPEGLWERL